MSGGLKHNGWDAFKDRILCHGFQCEKCWMYGGTLKDILDLENKPSEWVDTKKFYLITWGGDVLRDLLIEAKKAPNWVEIGAIYKITDDEITKFTSEDKIP